MGIATDVKFLFERRPMLQILNIQQIENNFFLEKIKIKQNGTKDIMYVIMVTNCCVV